MTDLLALARARVSTRTHYDGCEADHVECLIHALADEIGRLRALVEHHARHRDPRECEEIEAERDELRGEVERLRAWQRSAIGPLQAAYGEACVDHNPECPYCLAYDLCECPCCQAHDLIGGAQS